MTTARVGTLAWLAIFVGMFLLGLGLSIRNGDASFGIAVAVVGGLGILSGAVLIWVRSRMADGDSP